MNNKLITVLSIYLVLNPIIMLFVLLNTVFDTFERNSTEDELKTLYYTDMNTCVLYLTNDKGVSVMLDKDSKVMLDQECILSKEGLE